MQKRTMQDVASEYAMGFITYTELVEKMCQCDHEDAQIMAEEVDKVMQSDEYHELQQEFARKLGAIYEMHRDIDCIASYYINKAYRKKP